MTTINMSSVVIYKNKGGGGYEGSDSRGAVAEFTTRTIRAKWRPLIQSGEDA